jgi:hypothetical protein
MLHLSKHLRSMQCAGCFAPKVTVRARHGRFTYPFCSTACSQSFCKQIGTPVGKNEDFGLPPGEWSSLPDEIKLITLNKIPLLKLLQRTRVSPEWNSLLQDDATLWRNFYLKSIARKFGAPTERILSNWRDQTLQYVSMFDYVSGELPTPPAPIADGVRSLIFQQVTETEVHCYESEGLTMLRREITRLYPKATSFVFQMPNGTRWLRTMYSYDEKGFIPMGGQYLLGLPVLIRQSSNTDLLTSLLTLNPDEKTTEIKGFRIFHQPRSIFRFIAGKSNPAWPVIYLDEISRSRWAIHNPKEFAALLLRSQVITEEMTIDVKISRLGKALQFKMSELLRGNGEASTSSPSFGIPAASLNPAAVGFGPLPAWIPPQLAYFGPGPVPAAPAAPVPAPAPVPAVPAVPAVPVHPFAPVAPAGFFGGLEFPLLNPQQADWDALHNALAAAPANPLSVAVTNPTVELLRNNYSQPTLTVEKRTWMIPAVFLIENNITPSGSFPRPYAVKPEHAYTAVLRPHARHSPQQEPGARLFDQLFIAENTTVFHPYSSTEFLSDIQTANSPMEDIFLHEHHIYIPTDNLVATVVIPQMQVNLSSVAHEGASAFITGQHQPLMEMDEGATQLSLTFDLIITEIKDVLDEEDNLRFELMIGGVSNVRLTGPPRAQSLTEYIDFKINLSNDDFVRNFQPNVTNRIPVERREAWVQQWIRTHPGFAVSDAPVKFWLRFSNDLLQEHINIFLGRYFPKHALFLPVSDSALGQYSDPQRLLVNATTLGIAHPLRQ